MAEAGLRPPERLFLRYPHELSGGQKQRVLIAGALALRPQMLIADEPVSSLDASIRGEILALLLRLREELGVGVVVVTHDLGLAWNIADRIAVMYLGRVVECGTTEEVLESPRHPYTQALLSVVPEIERLEPVVLTGEIPDPTRIPGGCRFHPRCPALARRERRGRRGRRSSAVGEPLSVLAGHRRATAPPATSAAARARTSTLWPGPGPCHDCLLTRESVSARRTRCPTARPAGGAAPRDVRRPRAPGSPSGRRAVRRVVLRRAGIDDLGLDAPSRVASSTSRASRCWSPATHDGALHAAYNVCRHRGSQIRPRARPGRPVACDLAALRCPYHSWTYGLDGRLLRAPHAELSGVDLDEFRLAPVGVEHLGRLRVRPPHPGATRRPSPRPVARADVTLANYGLGRPGDRRDAAATRWPPTTRCCWRTTTSATTAGRCTRSSAGWCRRSRAGASDLDWEGGRAAPRRRLDLHHHRHHDRARRCPA